MDSSEKPVRIVIVEDDADVSARISNHIEQESTLELLAACADVASGMSALLTHKPDVLLTDLGLPDGSGTELITAIHSNRLDTQALVLSGFQDEKVVFDALEAGAQGYILKQDTSQKMVDVIRQLLAGGSPISPVIARLMLQKFSHEQTTETLPEALTERQQSILKYVSQGFSSVEISEKLDISYHTVTTHIKNIYNKLQVNSRAEALYEARRLGLI